MKILIIILIVLFTLFIVAMIIGRIHLRLRFRRQVKHLFAKSQNISNKTFRYSQLAGLPEPVKTFFNYVLEDGQSYISYARITHDGQFKTGIDKEWVSIKGEQYATTATPGFIWKGVTSMFTARDFFIADKGGLVVSLFATLNVVNAMGSRYDEGELLRWLGESVLYPTNLLPNDHLHWEKIDSASAKLTFNYLGLTLFFIVSFNTLGEIIQMETKRFMDKTNRKTWVIQLSDYKEINEVRVATKFTVLWRLDKGDFAYAKFNITKIEYDIPEIFHHSKLDSAIEMPAC